VLQAVRAAFRFSEDASKDDVAKFVPAVLSLHTLKAFTHVQDAPQKRKRDDNGERMTTQGSILLQRIAQLPAPHQTWLYESLCTDALGSWCRSSTAAHVVIAALTSKAASFAQRRMLIRAVMPMLIDLCDDAWAVAAQMRHSLWPAPIAPCTGNRNHKDADRPGPRGWVYVKLCARASRAPLHRA